MTVNRPDQTPRTELITNTRRAPHPGIPAQHRRSIPMPDGVARAGRVSSARRERAGTGSVLDPLTAAPRGFPIGDPNYRPWRGQPEGGDDRDYDDRDYDDREYDDSVPADDQPAPADLSEPSAKTGRAFGALRSGRTRPRNAVQGDQARFLRRVGTGRAPIRSAVIGGALVFAVLGAGFAAWAMVPTSPDAEDNTVNQQDPAGPTTLFDPDNSSVAVPSTAAAPAATVAPPATVGPITGGSEDNGAPEDAATNSSIDAPAPPVPAIIPTSPAQRPDDLGPATVSAIPPGDPGFGWPSTAFGLPAEPTPDQSEN